MDKGIRVNVNNKFAELLKERNASTDPARNKRFRRDVMQYAIDEFDCTVASAATHYNHALKLWQKQFPEQVEGLGRPEDKKGGRKKKVVAETGAAVNENDAGETGEAQTVFTVKKKKDDSVVAEGLSLEDARALCVKAAAAKKAALYWV